MLIRTQVIGALAALLWATGANTALHGVGGIPGGGSGCTDGNKGDVTVSGGCTSFVVTGGSAIDNLFTFIDNLDATRRGQFDASVAPVGTTLYKLPAAAGTLARLEDIPQFQSGSYTASTCGVAYNGTGFAYTVAACSYVIDGTPYNSPQGTVTLAAADPTNDRIDIIAVNSSSIATSITGTPAVNPVAPDVDPDTQLQLTFVYVVAAATQPGVVQTAQYRENLGPPDEWTYSDNTANFDPDNTAQPYAGTKDIGATSVVAGNQFILTNGSDIDLSQQNYFVFRLRPNGTWPGTKSLRVQWLNGATALGSFVTVQNGTFGFNTATASYQLIAIPISMFNLNGQGVDAVRVRVNGLGAAFSFYVDNVELQAGVAPPPATDPMMEFIGDWAAATSYTPQQVVRSGLQSYVAVSANSNSAPTYADINPAWKRLQADETTTTLGTLVNGATDKATPVDADLIPLADSAASFITKKLTWANIKATLWGTGLDADGAFGFRGIPINNQTGNYTTVAADAGKTMFHASGDGAGDTYTIDSNANVAYEIGTAITFINMSTDTLAIAVTSDTLILCGTGATGTRTLAQYGVWTAVKVTSTSWIGCGTGAT